MKKRTVLFTLVFLAILFALPIVAYANAPLSIISVEENTEAADGTVSFTIVTGTGVNNVWVKHSDPPRWPRAERITGDALSQTWEVVFTPTHAGSQYVEVWANRGFWLQGASMQELYVDTSAPIKTDPVIRNVDITRLPGAVHLSVTTEGEVNNVWVRHSNPARFPQAVRTGGDDTTQVWEIIVTPAVLGTQTFAVYANRGFWLSGAVSQTHSITVQARITAPTPSPTPEPTTPVPTPTPAPIHTPLPTLTPTPTPTPIPTPTPAPTPTPIPFNAYDFEQRVLELVNIERANQGVPALALDSTLAAVARNHSIDMATNDFMSHTGSDGSSPFDRMLAAGLSWSHAAANVAAGRQTPEAVVTAWMNSPGHRANILNANLKYIGVGVHRLAGTQWTYYWTQKFATFG
ncbi:MAG: CAP domain-containing protein [Defluviitaleaceae bacterium]|nr:CAP domain-containing protein [Defluviitaleaceae bacterium]